MSDQLKQLDEQIVKQGDTVRALKAKKADKEELNAAVELLKELKLKRQQEADSTKEAKFDRAALESLLLKRFFYAPAFQIYGGIAGLYDFGPPGSSLQNNLLSIWRQHFVLEEDMLELECTNLTPESVLKTSGHVERFADYMVNDTVTGDIFRADHLVKQVLKQRLEDDTQLKAGKKIKKAIKLEEAVREDYLMILETLDNYVGDDLHDLIVKHDIRAPETNNPVTKPSLFNLMFETQIGPTGQFKGYLRPETAQGHFLNFKKLLEFNTDQMPFASATIGKSFRNEISPRAGLLRVREFTMAEVEHFVDPLKKSHRRFNSVRHIVMPLYSKTNQMAAAGPVELSIGEAVDQGIVDNETLGYFLARIYLYLIRIGIDKSRLRFRQHMENEMAHYATDCWDAEIESSYGWIECVGCADRSAYDLTAHARKTKEKLVVREALAEPVVWNGLVCEVNKKVFGPAFRGEAKFVQGWVDSLMDCTSDNWDQEKLAKLKQDLADGAGKTKITGTNGKEYEVTSDMVKVVEKTIKTSVREYTPNVIEPSFGIGRILYSLLEHCYSAREGDEKRQLLSFPPSVAPTKALIAPISHSEQFMPFIDQVASELRKRGLSNKTDDSAGSIGRRYARNDELGTPFAVTIDFETVKDGTVTLRERDSTKQIRESISTIVDLVSDLCESRITWEDVTKKYKTFDSKAE